ncbi:TetR/AcrR family transcriptional regulator [Roseomonas sp. GC11]|uniref:TetR/AcrR family transcriptional regulator n=1 Tax=Roseomonas sp. GC11 TaxID=2950546 RepID=UPI00210C272F|nr:TetR/AcrR family transcriptional regulator [Roseomonas sp. GC11]MCQ4160081.1 TetR/AcrR family transcriptional regulator [Roseomonas sp. GC11]
MTSPSPRRTQEARREETRQRLLRATIALLLERGYSRLTTPDIARAAGVSRGALTHHFVNKEDIVVRAIAFQLDEVTEGLRRMCEGAPVLSTEQVVDYLWRMMAEGLFYVTMEYLPEARHNEAFRARLRPVVREFHAALDAIWDRLSAAAGIPAEQARVSLNATMCLFRGMIAQTVLRDDPAYYAELLDYWKRHLRGGLGMPRAAA